MKKPVKNNFKHIEINTQMVYEEEALSYDLQRGKSLFEKNWLDLFISKLEPESKILDVGCGSGEPIAKYLIDRGLHLVGVDYSKAMIDIVKSKFPQNEWIHCRMQDLNFDKKFNGIIAWNSFFHLNQEDQKSTLDVFANHLVTNGVLLFTAGPDEGEVLGKVNGRDVYHSSLSADEYKKILEINGMKLIQYKLNDDECNNHCVFFAQKIF